MGSTIRCIQGTKAKNDKVIARLGDDKLLRVSIKDTIGGLQEITVVNEFGIYEAVFERMKISMLPTNVI